MPSLLGVADLRPHSLRPDGTVDIDLLAGLHQPQAHFPCRLVLCRNFPGQQWEETSNRGQIGTSPSANTSRAFSLAKAMDFSLPRHAGAHRCK